MKNASKKIRRCKKYNILVVRVNSSGKLCNSRPCNNCIQTMREIGIIDTVFYSDKDGNIVSEKLDQMDMIHETYGFANYCKNVNKKG